MVQIKNSKKDHISKISKKLSSLLYNYFLGTETSRFFKIERNIYNNQILDKEELDKRIRVSRFEEFLYIHVGKGLSSILSLSAAGYYLANNEIPSWIFFGETLRVTSIYSFYCQRDKKEEFFDELESGKYEKYERKQLEEKPKKTK